MLRSAATVRVVAVPRPSEGVRQPGGAPNTPAVGLPDSATGNSVPPARQKFSGRLEAGIMLGATAPPGDRGRPCLHLRTASPAAPAPIRRRAARKELALARFGDIRI